MKAPLTDILLILVLLVPATSSFMIQRHNRPLLRRPGFKWYSLAGRRPSLSRGKTSFQRLREQMANLHESKLSHGSRPNKVKNTCRLESLILKIDIVPVYSIPCSPMVVETDGCRGGCHTYSQVDPRNHTNIVHSCSCCRPLHSTMAVIPVKCPLPTRFSYVVHRATACQCRPCYAGKGTKEFHSIRDHYKKDSPFSVG